MSHRGIAHRRNMAVGKYEAVTLRPFWILGIVIYKIKKKTPEKINHTHPPPPVSPAPASTSISITDWRISLAFNSSSLIFSSCIDIKGYRNKSVALLNLYSAIVPVMQH